MQGRFSGATIGSANARTCTGCRALRTLRRRTTMLPVPLSSDGLTATAGALRFSSAMLPERDRVPAFREAFGRELVRCDFEPLEWPFHADMTLRDLPGLGIASVGHSQMRVGRTQSLLTDGDDALVLQITKAGGTAAQSGREAEVRPGDAVLTTNEQVFQFTGVRASNCVILSLSRSVLRPLLSDFDTVLLRPVPSDTSALILLKRYLGIFDEGQALTSELVRLAVGHVYDLVAAALGATRDAIEIGNGRGVRAARLRAMKTYIAERMSSGSLTVDAVAARHDVTPRYVQILFEAEGTTFSEFLLGQRLQRAHRLLLNPAFDSQKIAAIAFDVGFNDLSYFNRTFRKQFGATPSDLRATARRQH